MPSYLVTGISRGLGFELASQLSEVPEHTVIGLVRDKDATLAKISKELPGRKNLHVVQGDLLDAESLKAAASETAKFTGGSLDVLIANAGVVSGIDRFRPIGVLANDSKLIEKDMIQKFHINAVGNVHLFHAFLPLIQCGNIRKVVAISTGNTDLDMVAEKQIPSGSLYSISKIALNMAVAKFHAQYAKEGILFMAVCPGHVDTGHLDRLTPEEKAQVAILVAQFSKSAPPMAAVKDAVHDVLRLIENADMQTNGGRLVSHHGNRQWI